jgi:hypothetical protein
MSLNLFTDSVGTTVAANQCIGRGDAAFSKGATHTGETGVRPRAVSGPRHGPEIEPGSHLHQIGQRLSLHLFHHAASVFFYGGLGDSEFASNLLIQDAADHQRHHLLLTSAERRVPLFKPLPLGQLNERNPAAFEGVSNSIAEHVVRKRLGQEFNSAGLHSPDGSGDVAMARDEDDWHLTPTLTDALLQVKSAETRKRYIKYQTVRDEDP